MSAKPRKPWRVILGPDVAPMTDHATAAEANTSARAALDGKSAQLAKVFEWRRGRWWLCETFHAHDIPQEPS
ncbi:hypothetical protein ACI3K5_23660 [Streptomyces sp. MPA0124]|uniref:hypothetical protein n=1 Tax=Streptomyces sp. MPA0124 TaxID=3378069 RepID=UPI003853CD35